MGISSVLKRRRSRHVLIGWRRGLPSHFSRLGQARVRAIPTVATPTPTRAMIVSVDILLFLGSVVVLTLRGRIIAYVVMKKVESIILKRKSGFTEVCELSDPFPWNLGRIDSYERCARSLYGKRPSTFDVSMPAEGRRSEGHHEGQRRLRERPELNARCGSD
ncbi:hypothetical protein IQ07DRAFT_38729 [Pyrenochaeta sp. DS3sAY3a]|nr:hypothetical protein IQ07DRAFT_38729 [Pyrenochaeta sp. DS3sAY3a]